MYRKTPHYILHYYPCYPYSTFSARQQIAYANFTDEPSTIIQFTYHTNAQMWSTLKRTAAKCAHISRTYSIGRSVEGKDLLVIEFSNNPGEHELCEYSQRGALGLFCLDDF